MGTILVLATLVTTGHSFFWEDFLAPTVINSEQELKGNLTNGMGQLEEKGGFLTLPYSIQNEIKFY